MQANLHEREWVTVKMPRDLLDVIDAFILKPVKGMRVFDSRPAFIRAVCIQYLQTHGENMAKIIQKEKEGNIVA